LKLTIKILIINDLNKIKPLFFNKLSLFFYYFQPLIRIKITSEVLSKKYNERPPHQEFEQLIDSFFDFLGDK